MSKYDHTLTVWLVPALRPGLQTACLLAAFLVTACATTSRDPVPSQDIPEPAPVESAPKPENTWVPKVICKVRSGITWKPRWYPMIQK